MRLRKRQMLSPEPMPVKQRSQTRCDGWRGTKCGECTQRVATGDHRPHTAAGAPTGGRRAVGHVGAWQTDPDGLPAVSDFGRAQFVDFAHGRTMFRKRFSVRLKSPDACQAFAFPAKLMRAPDDAALRSRPFVLVAIVAPLCPTRSGCDMSSTFQAVTSVQGFERVADSAQIDASPPRRIYLQNNRWNRRLRFGSPMIVEGEGSRSQEVGASQITPGRCSPAQSRRIHDPEIPGTVRYRPSGNRW
jgi:hypothetical protein